MKKAFIFDMDGVIVDTERAWLPYEKGLFKKLVGKSIANKLPDSTGLSIDIIYKEAIKLGHTGTKEEFIRIYNEYANKVYKDTVLTNGTDRLINVLQTDGFEIGLVSSSPQNWINMYLRRISFKNAFKQIISLDNHPKLRAKPHPDGYIAMMQLLGVSPGKTIVLEDSNYGIEAGKKSGAFVIGFRENLHEGYEQKGADIYAKNMEHVIAIVKKYLIQNL